MTTTDHAPVGGGAVDEDSSRPLRKDAARNRDALIAAGRQVFAERGLDASLDDIAHRAGVGVGTAYRRFANKFELAQAIFAQTVDELVAVAEDATQLDSGWDGIVALIERSAQAQIADRGLREILMGVHDAEAFDSVADRMGPPTERLVARARAEGSVRADVETSDLWMVLVMLFSVSDLAGDAAPDLWRRYLPALLEGLKPAADVPTQAAVDVPTLRDALRSHKQRLAHGLPPGSLRGC